MTDNIQQMTSTGAIMDTPKIARFRNDVTEYLGLCGDDCPDGVKRKIVDCYQVQRSHSDKPMTLTDEWILSLLYDYDIRYSYLTKIITMAATHGITVTDIELSGIHIEISFTVDSFPHSIYLPTETLQAR